MKPRSSLLLLLYLIVSNSLTIPRIRTIRRIFTASNTIDDFSIENYFKENIINFQQPITISFDTTFSVKPCNNSSTNHSNVILLSLGLRSVDDIVTANPNIPGWAKFSSKMRASNQDISSDKFLYSHDVGDLHVQKV